MSSVTINPPQIKVTVDLRHRKNVLYQVTYEFLKVFHAPNMKRVGRILYAGIIDTQALDEVKLVFLGKGGTVIFYITLFFDWDVYEILVNSSQKYIEVSSSLSSIDQFIGNKLAFEEMYKSLLSAAVIYSKEVWYCVNPKQKAELEKIVGEFYPVSIGTDTYEEITYSPNELKEMKVSIFVNKTYKKVSSLKWVLNKLHGI